MSSSSSPRPRPCFTTPFPAVTLEQLSSDSTYHDNAEHFNQERSMDKAHTRSSSCEMSQEPSYNSDSEQVLERQQPQRPRQSSIWTRVVSPLFASSPKNKIPDAAVPLLPFYSNNSKIHRRWLRKPTRSCCALYCVVGVLAMLGVFQFLSISCGLIISFFPDEIDRVTDRWRQPQTLDPADSAHWPTDISRDIFPVRCHSHNDYWRRVPLYSALEAGCVSVEADVWLFDDELYVGHSRSSLTSSRTLKSMYVDPLMKILRRQNPVTHFHPKRDLPRNGVFDTDPSQTLVLLIDFKTDGEETWNEVVTQLGPLRESGYLTYYNGTDIIEGPITVVGTGNAPFNRIAAKTSHRDIFFDAPLDRLVDTVDRIEPSTLLKKRTDNAGQGLSGISKGEIEPDTFNTTNSYYASVSFKKAVGIPWMLHLTDRQVQTIRSQIRAAHRQGLKVRYWGAPDWPRSLRNHIWRVLAREGADMLNVDDLVSATRKDWAPKFSDWWH